MKLIIEIEVANDVEAYLLVNKLSWEHKVLSSTYNKITSVFDKDNTPKEFLKTGVDQAKDIIL